MARSERVLSSLRSLCRQVGRKEILDGFNGFSTEEICTNCGVDRANASRELNQLVLAGAAVKVRGRPVSYFDAGILQQLLKIDAVPSQALESLRSACPVDALIEGPVGRNIAEDFDLILSYCPSLDNVVKQCKAAIIYPPNGLHTLLVGPSGVGKTMYAEAMYHFARKMELLESKAQFILFNCAEYADNPQLLLSQLFGYTKGAFTGADRDQPGVIDRADGGVLLLDEIHRLPPQGQEMLFTLMDKGYFHRLGKTGRPVPVNLRLVCATSEEVESHILTTFLRRIPMVIRIPALREYPLTDRFNMIRRFFIREADALGHPLKVSWKVIRGLLLYDPKGNMGQLKSNIQLSCARGYLDHTLRGRKEPCIHIGIHVVPDEVAQGVLNLEGSRKEIQQLWDELGNQEEITFHDGSPILDNEPDTSQLYGQIQQLYEKYTSRNMDKASVGENINLFIQDYISGLMSKSSLAASREENTKLYKMVSHRVCDTAASALNAAGQMLGRTISQKVLVAFALHVSVLLERINTQYATHVRPENLRGLMEERPEEYAAARRMWEMVRGQLGVSIPEEEIVLFSAFLRSREDGSAPKEERLVGVVVLAHGQQTASSMAEVANLLLKTDRCKAVDMDLSESVEHCLQRACLQVRRADEGKGVLLLADMGSLTAFADLVNRKTGIPVRGIDMVSTPLVLEAVRKSLFPSETLDSIAESLMRNIPYIAKGVSQEVTAQVRRQERPLIVTTCASGLGAAKRLAQLIQKRVPSVTPLQVEVKAMEYRGRELTEEDAARTVAVVGFQDLHLPGVPYISTDEIVMGQGFQSLENLLQGQGRDRSVSEPSREVPSYLVDNMLREYLAFLDPVKASRAAERSFRRIWEERSWPDLSRVQLCYYIHVCCLVERGIQNQYLACDGVEERLGRDPALTRLARSAVAVLEQDFNLRIPDTELAYILDILDID